MIDYRLPKESFDPQKILQRMSEDGVCLLTGVKEKLSFVPVDMDIQTCIASNVACVDSAIAEKLDFTISYTADLWDYKIKFDTPEIFEPYNRDLVDLLAGDLELKPKFAEATPTNLVKLFETLTARHLKGIFSIVGGPYTLDRMQFQGYVARQLIRFQDTVKTSPIQLATH